MALCPSDAARLELSRLGAELNLGASSPEWIMVVLYGEARGIFGATKDRDELGAQLAVMKAQLDRIEKRNRGGGMRDPTASLFRDLFAFLAGMTVWIAVAVLANSVRPGYLELLCAAVLGAGATVAYMWLAPRIQDAVNSR
jgi:hypothetical protein